MEKNNFSKILKENLPTVQAIANKYNRNIVPLKELETVAKTAFYEAFRNYDSSKGTLINYASYYIKTDVNNYQDEIKYGTSEDTLVRAYNKVDKFIKKNYRENINEIDFTSLIEETGMSEEELTRIYLVVKQKLSLDQETTQNKSDGKYSQDKITSYHEIFQCKDNDPFEFAARSLLKCEVDKRIEKLTVSQKEILNKRYGLDGKGCFKFSEITLTNGRNNARLHKKSISRICKTAENKLSRDQAMRQLHFDHIEEGVVS